eukprot:scaffold363_cov56-Cylindrotheca_fusiformis.AAC.33
MPHTHIDPPLFLVSLPHHSRINAFFIMRLARNRYDGGIKKLIVPTMMMMVIMISLFSESAVISNFTSSSLSSSNLEVMNENLDSTTTNYMELRASVKQQFQQLPQSTKKQMERPLIFPHFLRRSSRLPENDIVLATHMSTSKFDNFLLQLQYWNGPASVSIYIKSIEEIDQFFDFIDDNKNNNNHVLLLDETSFHIIMEKTTDLLYPHNILRQVAMESIESNYFVAMDVDLIPFPKNCHDHLVQAVSRIDPLPHNIFLVFPSFALLPRRPTEDYATADMLPESKQDAVIMYRQKKLIMFHGQEFPQGQAPTQYDIWLENVGHDDHGPIGKNANSSAITANNNNNNAHDDAYPISVTAEQARDYEPYVMGYRGDGPSSMMMPPRYWEGFRGFGRDKISFFHECYSAGYRYRVLNDFFCIHLEHPTQTQEEKMKELKDNQETRLAFYAHLKERYGVEATI